MATAKVYDDWDDVAMTFTEEQLKEFDPMLSASARANRLIDLVPVVQRRSALGELPAWWTEVAKRMTVCALWDLFRTGQPRLDVEELNRVCSEAAGQELKALTLAAHKLGPPSEFAEAWRMEVTAALRLAVTLGRRCMTSPRVSGWKKENGSVSNKVANALLKELHAVDTCVESLHAYTVQGKGG